MVNEAMVEEVTKKDIHKMQQPAEHKLLLFLFIFLISCRSKEEQLKCLEEGIVTKERDKESQDLKLAVTDSIRNWTRHELKYTGGYSDSVSIWKIDKIILNENKTRLFGWVLKIKNTGAENPLDYVEYFAGEKRSGIWHFYIHHMPSIWFDRKENNNQPYSFEYLSRAAKEKVIRGGIVDRWNCKINDSYINEWIDREDRELYKWHQDFLKSGKSQ